MEDNNSDSDIANLDSDNDSDNSENVHDSEEQETSNTIPISSRRLYERQYEKFKDWCLQMKTTETDDKVILTYFQTLSKRFKATTLWSVYSRLKPILLLKENIDMRKNKKLQSFLKQKEKQHTVKKTKVFTKEQVSRFLETAPDDDFLLHKVVLIVGLYGRLRTVELLKINMSHIKRQGNLYYISLPTKKKSGKKSFVISEEASAYLSKYMRRRPSGEQRFFLQYRNKTCIRQNLGKNKIGSMPKDIAEFLDLPDSVRYTGHAFRSTSTMLLNDEAANILSFNNYRERNLLLLNETMNSHNNKDERNRSDYINKGVVNSHSNEERLSSAFISCETIKQESDNDLEDETMQTHRLSSPFINCETIKQENDNISENETMQSHSNKDGQSRSDYANAGIENNYNNEEKSTSAHLNCEIIKQEHDYNLEINLDTENSIEEGTNYNPDEITTENCDYDSIHKENFSTVFVSCGILEEDHDNNIEHDIREEDPFQEKTHPKEIRDDSNCNKNHKGSSSNSEIIEEDHDTADNSDSFSNHQFDDETSTLDKNNVTSKSKAEKEFVKCSRCGIQLKNLDMMRKHVKRCIELNYFCKLCPYKSKYKECFDKHQEVHLEHTKGENDKEANKLLEKSKHRYSAAYSELKKWQKQHDTNSLDEKIFLEYFEDLSKTHAPPTLWARFSMLKATVNTYDNINIGAYKNLIAFLKEKNVGYKVKKSKVFSSSEISKFCNDAPDDTYLVAKVVLIFGITGACRLEELTHMTVNHIQDHNNIYLVTVPRTKSGITRSFTIVGDFYKIVQQYIKLRPEECDTDRFFLCYRGGKCTKQVVGVNTIGTIPSRIAKYLELPEPELYTGHSFRRTSAKLLVEAGGDVSILKRKGAWKSKTMADSYVTPISNEKGIGAQITSSIMISKPSTSSSSSDCDEPMPKSAKLDSNNVNTSQTTDQSSCERLPDSSTSNVDNTSNSETGGQFKECPKCKKMLNYSESLKKHIKLCGVEQTYSCEFCSYKSKFKKCFDRHKRCHLESMKASVKGVTEGKSKRKYSAAYEDFKKWQTEQKTDSLDEKVFLDYFTGLSKIYASPTLWTRYSMLKATISNRDNVDIGPYKNLIAFLKSKSVGHKGRKSKVFTSAEVLKFCNDAPDDMYLVTKVALILGVTGTCRREELTYLTMSNIKDHGTMYLISIPSMKTGVERSFTVVGDFYSICQRYLNLRPKDCDTDRVFLSYRDGKCTRQPIGINTIGAMPCRIASFLHLPYPKLYTGHCFRRTSAKLLVERGNNAILKRRGIRTVSDSEEDSSSNEKEDEEQITSPTKVSKSLTFNLISKREELISKQFEEPTSGCVDPLITGQASCVKDS